MPDVILIIANITLAVLVAYTCINIDNSIVHIQKPTFQSSVYTSNIRKPVRTSYRLYYTILLPLMIGILFSNQASLTIGFQVMTLFVAGIWLTKSINLYEEQIQEQEIEEIDTECQSMLRKMVIQKENPKDFELTEP